MSRRRLGDELNNLINERFPLEKREEAWASYQESLNNPDSFSYKLNKYFDQLGDEQRNKLFSGFFKFNLDNYEKEYLAGSSIALMRCIDFCCAKQLVIPNWAAEAFHQGYIKVMNYEARSWDTVFGKPHKKGMHLKDQRCDEDKQLIHKCVRELINQGCPIDEGLFETVGKRFGSKGREIRDIYYDQEHQRIEQLHSLYKGMEIVDKALKQVRQRKSK